MTEYALERIPENAGLIEVIPHKPFGKVKIVKAAPVHKGAKKVTDKMLYDLQRYMGMRYWSRQQALRKNKWYEYVDQYNKEQRELKKNKLFIE